MMWCLLYFLGVVGVVGGVGGVGVVGGIGVVGSCPKPDEIWSYADDHSLLDHHVLHFDHPIVGIHFHSLNIKQTLEE